MKGRHTADEYVRPEIGGKPLVCNLCGSEGGGSFCPTNGLGLVQCTNCGLVYVRCRPDVSKLYSIYGESYFTNDSSHLVGYTNYREDEANIRKTARRRLSLLEKSIRPGRLLDVGCALGFCLAEAVSRGWKVQGLDISEYAVEYAAQTFGLDVRQGSLTSLDYPNGTYDLIIMWDLIEHVPDPRAYIRRAMELLKPGGFLSIVTPDLGSVPAQLTKERWVGYKLSREHLYYFSRQTISRMLKGEGFRIATTSHVGKYVKFSLFVNRLSLYTPRLAKVLEAAERSLQLSNWSLYINPFDMVSVTARKEASS